jgi:hypothetical protein
MVDQPISLALVAMAKGDQLTHIVTRSGAFAKQAESFAATRTFASQKPVRQKSDNNYDDGDCNDGT